MAFTVAFILIIAFFKSGSTQTCTPFQGYLEGDFIQGQPKACPSGQCLTFHVYCDDYQITQCYDPTKPMAIINQYKPAKSFYANPKKFWSLKKCDNDGYCSDMSPDPISFDSLLWPKAKKPPAKVLENSIKATTIYEDETIEISGPVQKGATQVWIRLDMLNTMGQYSKFRVTFAVPKQQYRLAGKKWKSAKGWSKKLARGSDLTITIRGTYSAYRILANDNDLGFKIHRGTRSLTNIAFGGKWAPKTVLQNDDWGLNSVFFGPKFSIFQPTKVRSSVCNPKTIAPSSTIKYRDISKQLDQDGTVDIELTRNGMTGYGHEVFELRKSLCEDSLLAHFEIGSWKKGKDGQFRIYVKMRQRSGYRWDDQYETADIDAAECKTYKITVEDYLVNFVCDDTPLTTLSWFNAKVNLKYLVEQTEREVVCNK